MVCTKTLYNYLHQCLLGVKAIDLPLVVRRSIRKSIVRKHKRELEQSIELRDAKIETSKEFDHWELDVVRGAKDKTDDVLISLIERKSRLYIALRCPSSYSHDIKETLETWLSTFRKNRELGLLCKTIIADNGLEFADISELEDKILSILRIPIRLGNEVLMNSIMVYFAALFQKESESKMSQTIHSNEPFTGTIIYHVRYYITKHRKKSF